MTPEEFRNIATALGFTPGENEVSGRTVLQIPEQQRLARLARGEVATGERLELIRAMLSDRDMLECFAGEIRAANPGAGSRVEVMLKEEAEEEAEVSGRHDGASLAVQQPRMECFRCRRVFRLSEKPNPEKVYVCSCEAQNVPGINHGGNLWSGMDLPRIRSAPVAPVVLDTVFLTAPGGKVYEVPRHLLHSREVTPARRRELGHLPDLAPPFGGEGGDGGAEVSGRHKMPAPGCAANPSDWKYHMTWEYGCYFCVPNNAFVVGYHRHPYGDERATGAGDMDFS